MKSERAGEDGSGGPILPLPLTEVEMVLMVVRFDSMYDSERMNRVAVRSEPSRAPR